LSKLVPVSYRVLITKLRNLGFEGPHPGRKHPYMTKGNTVVIIPNPHHDGDIGVTLIKLILAEADISRQEWLSA
jgi:predicted RNA binding protein YcfA (HicA-like mRNA interferase family)